MISAGEFTQHPAMNGPENSAISDGIVIPIISVPEFPSIAGMSACEQDAKAAAGAIRSASASIAASLERYFICCHESLRVKA